MLVLFESPSGYAIFKVVDETKVQEAKDIDEHFQLAENATNVLKLKHFKKFEDTTEALAATTAAVEGKLCKPLKKMLRKVVAKDAHEKLAVADAKLGQAIKEKLNLPCIYSPAVEELMRGIRTHVNELITGLPEKDMTAMSLGLAHSLSRYKLKFSPDKVDTMIVQAISLLDDLDKELNNYVMRCREWFGWHFPELGKVVTDHLAFAKVIRKMGVRTNAAGSDLSEFVPEEIEQQIKDLAEVSMGTEISEEDILNITYLAEQIIEITEYRAQLYDYLKNRMAAIAPNLTILVGELVGARLIAHAGSLLNLAKHPASTVQILGAEKALFRALKTRKETPKYGLIYHASLVGQTNPKNKGKLSRMLAAKCSLAIRYDALAEETDCSMGIENRAKLEQRLKVIEGGHEGSRRISGAAKSLARDKWTNQSEVKLYDNGKDSTIPGPRKRKQEEETPSLIVADGNLQQPPKKKSKEEEVSVKKEKKKKKVKEEKVEEEESPTETPKKKKKKKNAEEAETPTKKKKTVKTESDAETPSKKKKVKIEKAEKDSTETETPSKKKKKKKSTAE